METKRFATFTEAVDWVMANKHMGNREAQDFVWDNMSENTYLKAIFLTIWD
jgi:hypothetical protein